jgi:hypothetical protein
VNTYEFPVEHKNTYEVLLPYIVDKNVLHIGFTDFPKTRKTKSFHLGIHKYCKTLDGYDINKPDNVEDIQVPNGKFIWNWEDINKTNYDTLVVREVIEHVDNVAEFLQRLDTIKGKLILTTPDALLLYRRNYFSEVKGTYFEKNHEDHNCWYTIFTLFNTIKKYSKRKIIEYCWVDNHSIFLVLDTVG